MVNRYLEQFSILFDDGLHAGRHKIAMHVHVQYATEDGPDSRVIVKKKS